MTEPKEFQGMQRAELVRLVVRHRELRQQAEARCERIRGRMLGYDCRLNEIADRLGLTIDHDLESAVGALVERSIELRAELDERLSSGTEVSYEECLNCAGVVVPCPDCGVIWAHGLGCPRR